MRSYAKFSSETNVPNTNVSDNNVLTYYMR